MRTALIADWLTVFGGAEHAIAELAKIWPDAPIFTTVARPERLGPLANKDIRTTSLQRWYRLLGKHQLLLPFLPRAIERIDLHGYDLIVSSSHAIGKGIIPPSSAVHVCYCHTPMRYAWEMENEYLQDFRVPLLLRRPIKRLLSRLRRWDLSTAKLVDLFIANSRETQERIQRIYGRESIVIPPPVDNRFFLQTLEPLETRSSYLAIGRLVPYKRFDLLIELANSKKLPLMIAGTGQEFDRLKAKAGPTVQLLGFVPEEELAQLYGRAKALLFPQFEDAGIVPLEAQACGTPVIAFGKGGALDSVVQDTTGILFQEQTAEALGAAINEFNSKKFDAEIIRNHARQFSGSMFRKRVKEAVTETMGRVKTASIRHVPIAMALVHGYSA